MDVDVIKCLKAWSIHHGYRNLYSMLNGDVDPDTYIINSTDVLDKRLDTLQKALTKQDYNDDSDPRVRKIVERRIERLKNEILEVRWSVERIAEWEAAKK